MRRCRSRPSGCTTSGSPLLPLPRAAWTCCPSRPSTTASTATTIGARRLTLSEKVAKAFVERGDKHVARLRRAEALLQRLQQLGDRVRPGCLDAQRAKVAHQRFRAGLPAARPLRVLPILLEAARGRYERFGRGKQAIVQDVFERG